MNSRTLLALILILIISSSCNKVNYNKLEATLENELMFFSQTEIPGELETLIESNRLIILGETRYVEEHHQYISLLLEQFGEEGLCFINEFSNAYNWMVEDYIRGDIQHLPYTIRLLNHTWLEKIRDINLAFEGELPVSFYFMDVNQWQDDFRVSIEESEKIVGEQSIFASIKRLDVDYQGYLNEMEDLKHLLEQESSYYLNLWGEKWYKRYKELIGLELESCRYRMSPDENSRELFMLDFIESTLRKTPEVRTVINCGMYHAQKESLMGASIQRLRALMEENNPQDMVSIAFSGIKGNKKYKFDSDEVLNFNVIENTADNNLMHMIGQRAGDQMSMLLLNDDIFEREMDVTYISGALRVAPGRQFDALITYPEIDILKSLSYFSE